MGTFSTGNIRNLTLAGHNGAGKTILAESLLFVTGAITRFGSIEDGNSSLDFEPEEIKRQASISTALTPVFYKDLKINLIDTPGYADFFGDVIGAIPASDTILLVVDGTTGVQVQTDKVFHWAPVETPKAFFINKLDKENSDFYSSVDSLVSFFGNRVAVLQIPIGKEAGLSGIVDIVKMKAFTFSNGKASETGLPDDLKTKAEEYREKLVEAVAETSDELMEKYFDTGELADNEILNGIKQGLANGKLFPVFCGSAKKLIGIQTFLDETCEVFPSPSDLPPRKGVNPKDNGPAERKADPSEPMSAFVFKTLTDPYVGKLNYVRVFSGHIKKDSHALNTTRDTKERIGHILTVKGKTQEDVIEAPAGDIIAIPKLNVTDTGDTLCFEGAPIKYDTPKYPEAVYSVAIDPKAKGDEEKMGIGLSKLAEEDPTLFVTRNPEIKQTIVSGMGDVHLEVVLERLLRKFHVEAALSAPRVPYRETIRSGAKAQGKYKKQSGGRGQYGDVWLELEPLPRGGGFEFVDKITGGVVPKNYIPSVEKGVKEAMESGVVAGYPFVDVKVSAYDGSHHPVDSSDMAFKIAGSMGFKAAVQAAKPVLLEPVMSLEIVVPEKYMGDVMGDMSGKRGKIQGMNARGKYQVIKSVAPLSEVARYATELRSITHGEGSFTMEFSHYEEVPADISNKIVEHYNKEKEKAQ